MLERLKEIELQKSHCLTATHRDVSLNHKNVNVKLEK